MIGKLLADLAVDRRLSMVLDVSQIEHDTDRNKFAREFGERFFFRKKAKPSAVLLFLEEGQEFVPQNPGKEENAMLRTYTRIAKIGRNFGIGVSVITQRPQEVNKKVLNLSELLLVFQLTGKHERKAVEDWIEDKAIDEDIAAELPKLEKWHPHAWSPAWLKVSKVVAIGERWTFDASSTPKVGGTAEVKELAPIDLDQLRKQMAATIERAKADDPKELRRRIAELEKQVRAKVPAAAPVRVETPVKEVQVVKDVQLNRLEKSAERLLEAGDAVVGMATSTEKLAQEILTAVRQARNNGHTPAPVSRPVSQPRPPATMTSGTPVQQYVASRVNRQLTEDTGEMLKPAQQAILNAAAFLESIGIQQPDVVQLALFAGQSATGGYWRANIGRCRTLGFIDGTRLTDTGRARAAPAEITTISELHQHIFDNLVTAPQQAILKVLIAAYPDALSVQEVGERANLEPNGGYWRANVGRLRSLKLITKKGAMQALPVLFLEDR